MQPVMEFFLDDVVQLRKSHPCGSDQWLVVRLGADIGLKCCKCQRRILLPRSTLERRIKKFISRGPGHTTRMGSAAGHK